MSMEYQSKPEKPARHVRAIDGRQIVAETYRILRPGGVFYADTVNWDSYTRRILGTGWRYIDPIDHVHLYTPRNVRELARRAGFEVERIWTTGARVEANQPGNTWRAPWYLRLAKGPLSLASRFTLKGDAIRFLLRKPQHSGRIDSHRGE